MSLGLIWFTLADSTVAPNFNVTGTRIVVFVCLFFAAVFSEQFHCVVTSGVLLISMALCADAAIGNVQEKAMKLHNGSNSEMVSGKSCGENDGN